MKMKLDILTIGTIMLFTAARIALADDSSTTAQDTRYGLFNSLDHRSGYGQGVFPEPFQVDDSDLETREFRLDWLHAASVGDYGDVIHPEIEWGFVNLTLELEVPYERDIEDGRLTKGFDNVDAGARYPFYQYVSGNNLFDT